MPTGRADSAADRVISGLKSPVSGSKMRRPVQKSLSSLLSDCLPALGPSSQSSLLPLSNVAFLRRFTLQAGARFAFFFFALVFVAVAEGLFFFLSFPLSPDWAT